MSMHIHVHVQANIICNEDIMKVYSFFMSGYSNMSGHVYVWAVHRGALIMQA